MIVEKTIQIDKEDRKAINMVSFILKAIGENGLYGLRDLKEIANGTYTSGNIKIELKKEEK